jgi:hypothetical protein
VSGKPLTAVAMELKFNNTSAFIGMFQAASRNHAPTVAAAEDSDARTRKKPRRPAPGHSVQRHGLRDPSSAFPARRLRSKPGEFCLQMSQLRRPPHAWGRRL